MFVYLSSWIRRRDIPTVLKQESLVQIPSFAKDEAIGLIPMMIFCVILLHAIALWVLLYIGPKALGSLHDGILGPAIVF
uniref:Uncharacterized protein n=1 Tax=Sphingobacterium sp. (strain 21) TaxID=743722 RepID=F4C8V7_SPHS2